jgi:hypothetical protein
MASQQPTFCEAYILRWAGLLRFLITLLNSDILGGDIHSM